MTQPLVVTVILNTNRRADTLACLESLRSGTYTNHRVLVLDNASTDGSVEAISEHFPEVQIIPLTANLGYAGNNNVGIMAALELGADWVFVLNEDTILAPDCIERLVEAGTQDQRLGIVGPMVYHHDEPTTIQSAGGRIGPYWNAWHLAQKEPDQGQYAAPHQVDWISGCAILVRRQVIEQVGALDERFFYYWEETEWCLRTTRHGWRIMHIPAAQLWHKGVQRDYQPKPMVSYYNTRNHFLMMQKHHAPLTAWIYTWGQLLRTLTSYAIRPKWRHKAEHRDAMWRGIVDFLQQRHGKASF